MNVDVELRPVPIEHKSVLRNLMELCQHDYSEFNGEEVNEHGLFGYRYLDHYWTEAGRHPFFVLVSGKLAGFALVRALSEGGGGEPTYSLAEFFILRKYRRQGVGQQAARQVFNLFPGTWRVSQEAENLAAQAFWRKVISRYTDGRFSEVREAEWNGLVQTFQVPASSATEGQAV